MRGRIRTATVLTAAWAVAWAACGQGAGRVQLTVEESGAFRASERFVPGPADEEGWTRVGPMPETLEVATVRASPAALDATLEVKAQRFERGAADVDDLFRRSGTVTVKRAGDAVKGRVVRMPERSAGGAMPLLLGTERGVAWIPDVTAASEVDFELGAEALAPMLAWRLGGDGAAAGPVQVRYAATGISWEAVYEGTLAEDGRSLALGARAGIRNGTMRTYENATVRLALTEKAAYERVGGGGELRLRAAEDGRSLVPERTAASAGVAETYDLAGSVTLPAGETTWVGLGGEATWPCEVRLVYDGARFDRFQRNRRTDAAYGAESGTSVETRLRVTNSGKSAMPPGVVRVSRGEPGGGATEWLGTDRLPALRPGQSAELRLGPAQGLSGRRVQKRFAERAGGMGAEETFEIALENRSGRTCEVAVVERMYRGSAWEITSADSEHRPGRVEGEVEFPVTLKAGETRRISYTVAYQW